MFPYEKKTKNRRVAHFAVNGLHVGNGVGCPWAAHWNFAMQIRLPTSSIYRNSGQLSAQLSGQPTTFKYGTSEQFSGQPTELPTIKFNKWKPSLIHMQYICGICVYYACYLSIESHFVGVHGPYELHRKEEQIRGIAYFNTKMSYLSDFKRTKSKTLRTASTGRITN